MRSGPSESGYVTESKTVRSLKDEIREILLTEEEEAHLTPDEAQVYIKALTELERQLDLEEIAQGLTANLSQFMRQAWNIAEPETPLVWGWFYEYLCEWLELVSSGEFKQRYPDKLGLIINIPPRSGKSTFASVIWPVWTWLRFPGRRFLFASHSNPLAVHHNIKRKLLIQSLFFQERFGGRFKLTKVAGDMLVNDHTGQFHVTSISQGSTGFGGLILVVDDLLDREDAFSKVAKKKANSWIDSSFS